MQSPLKANGILREAVRVENVVETRPRENDLTRVLPVTMAKWFASFHRRMDALPALRVIAPVGNAALNAVLRNPLPVTKKGTWRLVRRGNQKTIDWPAKIGAWRGSVFTYRTEDGRKVQVIPTYHPSFIMRGGQTWDVWQEDWAKIAEAVQHKLARHPRVRTTLIQDLEELERFTAMVEALPRDAILAVDIENTKNGGHVLCIGFAVDPERPFVVATMKAWWGPGRLRAVWSCIRRMLRADCKKAFHYGLHDNYVLARKAGIRVRRWWWDTQHLHHLLDPRDRHSLAYCASRDLTVKFWKHEAKEGMEDGG